MHIASFLLKDDIRVCRRAKKNKMWYERDYTNMHNQRLFCDYNKLVLHKTQMVSNSDALEQSHCVTMLQTV